MARQAPALLELDQLLFKVRQPDPSQGSEVRVQSGPPADCCGSPRDEQTQSDVHGYRTRLAVGSKHLNPSQRHGEEGGEHDEKGGLVGPDSRRNGLVPTCR